MSREWFGNKRSHGWQMRCDDWDIDCRVRSDVRPTDDALPLEEFVDAGWYIARTHGDRCPACVAAAGGMAAVIQSRSTVDSANSPHPLMGGVA